MRTKQEIAEDVTRVIAEKFDISVNQIDDETKIDSLGADSLNRMQIMFWIEQEFCIELPGCAYNCKTVGEYIKLVSDAIGVES